MDRDVLIGKFYPLIVGFAALQVSCSGGGGDPPESEFVQACLTTQATRPMCECAAHQAKTKLKSSLYRAMVYDMQGKKEELAAIADKMSLDERAAFAQQQFEILASCPPEQSAP